MHLVLYKDVYCCLISIRSGPYYHKGSFNNYVAVQRGVGALDFATKLLQDFRRGAGHLQVLRSKSKI